MQQFERARVEAEVLLANQSFYRAFSEGDFPKMMELWAHVAPVACIHPGMAPLAGRAAVLKSWASILRRPPPQSMRCEQPHVLLFGTTALVTCYEGSGENPAHLAATNIFALEENQWRLVHHQAGPLMHPLAASSSGDALN
jgi:ketosteroid isomerase-like protein